MTPRSTPAVAAALALLGGAALAASALTDGWPGRNHANPNAPGAVGMFLANGIFDPADTTFVPPTGEDFDTVIMGRSPEQIGERRAEAVDYFLERFGVDFSFGDFAQGGNIILVHTYVDPRWNYRAYDLPGPRRVPPTGLIVHDCSYGMAVVGPQATLYGTWGGSNGTVVPGGTVAVDGEYLVQGTNEFRAGHPRNLYLRFQSASPIFDAFDPAGIEFDCRLDSGAFGPGLALGRQEVYALEDGRLQASIVNILQFPSTEWASEQDD